MHTIIFLLLIALWLKIAILHEVTTRTQPWHNLGHHRGQAVVLRELLKVRRGLALLNWTYSIVMILIVASDVTTSTFDVLPTAVWVIGLAALGQLIARQQIVQTTFLGWILWLQQKHHSFYGGMMSFYKAVEAVGRYLVPTHPVVRSKEELSRFIDHQYHTHRALTSVQKRQIERILQLEERPITEKVIPLAKALMIKGEETIGPLLLSDLHGDGHDAFVIYDKKRTTPIGLLNREVAVSHAGRKQALKAVALMSDQLVYLPETATMQQAMVTFIETNTPLSVIIDGEKQPVGVLYATDILRDLFEKS